MSLTDTQKTAGRMFRDARRSALFGLNQAQPPAGHALALWRVYRHDCPAHGGISIGIDLHEHYEASPLYWVCYCGSVGPAGSDVPHRDCDGGRVVTPEGFFAFIWKDGQCPDCGLTVRSRDGRLVLGADRPPAEVRVVGGQAGTHPGDSRLARS